MRWMMSKWNVRLYCFRLECDIVFCNTTIDRGDILALGASDIFLFSLRIWKKHIAVDICLEC